MVSDFERDGRGMVSDFVLGSYALASKPKTKPDPTLLSHSSTTPHSAEQGHRLASIGLAVAGRGP